MKEYLKIKLNKVGLVFTDEHNEKLQSYLYLVKCWNERINIVSKKDEKRLVNRHIVESLSVLKEIEIQPNAEILDIGSGAGFPSIPISVLRRDLNFTLVESKRLKVLFLKEVVSQLNLKNITVLCERVENLSQEKWKDYFDLAFSRAVASLEKVYGWSKNFLKPNGCYIAWKGGDIQKEIKEIISKFKKVDIKIINIDKRLVNPAEKKILVFIRQK
jgi:16S rRNA (guanine527-N7)-methyltransferase